MVMSVYSSAGMTKVKVGKEDQSSNEFVEKRRSALERYDKRKIFKTLQSHYNHFCFSWWMGRNIKHANNFPNYFLIVIMQHNQY